MNGTLPSNYIKFTKPGPSWKTLKSGPAELQISGALQSTHFLKRLASFAEAPKHITCPPPRTHQMSQHRRPQNKAFCIFVVKFMVVHRVPNIFDPRLFGLPLGPERHLVGSIYTWKGWGITVLRILNSQDFPSWKYVSKPQREGVLKVFLGWQYGTVLALYNKKHVYTVVLIWLHHTRSDKSSTWMNKQQDHTIG